MNRIRGGDDDGFTLIELVVVLVVSAVVISALMFGMFTTAHNTQATDAHFARSHDAQIFANYLTADALGATGATVATSHISAAGTYCVSAAATGTSVLRLRATSTSTSFQTSTTSINYILGTDNKVTRYLCGGRTATNVVGHAVSDVTVTCTGGAGSACDSSATGLSAAVTSTVSAADLDGSTPYVYTLNATFRNVYAPAPTAVPTPFVPPASGFPIIALGGGISIDRSGNSSITLPSGAGIATNGGGDFAGSNRPLSPPDAPIYATGDCPDRVCPTNWYPNSGTVADPYYGLPAPSSTVTQTNYNCSGNTVSPGVYANTLSIGGNTVCTLQPGIYIFHGGISLAGTSSMVSSGGVLLYFDNNSTISMGGGNSIKISPMSSGTYSGMSIFQAHGDTTSMSITGNPSISGPGTANAGIIYAPDEDYASNGNLSITCKQFIVSSITISGSAGGLTLTTG